VKSIASPVFMDSGPGPDGPSRKDTRVFQHPATTGSPKGGGAGLPGRSNGASLWRQRGPGRPASELGLVGPGQFGRLPDSSAIRRGGQRSKCPLRRRFRPAHAPDWLARQTRSQSSIGPRFACRSEFANRGSAGSAAARIASASHALPRAARRIQAAGAHRATAGRVRPSLRSGPIHRVSA
jgi:hypothetical protein